MRLALSDIQPTEHCLRKDSIEFFMNNPSRIFTQRNKIKIIEAFGQQFKYYALDGNHRMYTLHCQGIQEIDFPVEPESNESDIYLARIIHNMGIKGWADLGERLVSQKRWDELHSFEYMEAIINQYG